MVKENLIVCEKVILKLLTSPGAVGPAVSDRCVRVGFAIRVDAPAPGGGRALHRRVGPIGTAPRHKSRASVSVTRVHCVT